MGVSNTYKFTCDACDAKGESYGSPEHLPTGWVHALAPWRKARDFSLHLHHLYLCPTCADRLGLLVGALCHKGAPGHDDAEAAVQKITADHRVEPTGNRRCNNDDWSLFREHGRYKEEERKLAEAREMLKKK